MEKTLIKLLKGYQIFRKKYTMDDKSIMKVLADDGQQPEVMIVSCCDSRVDPAVILQCEPGDLFVVRNVANIVPGYDPNHYSSTIAALDFGVRRLEVRHLIILGHSKCAGIKTLMEMGEKPKNSVESWVCVLKGKMHLPKPYNTENSDKCAQDALKQSYQNCITFPSIKEKLSEGKLSIHLWFFDIATGQIKIYCSETDKYVSFC